MDYMRRNSRDQAGMGCKGCHVHACSAVSSVMVGSDGDDEGVNTLEIRTFIFHRHTTSAKSHKCS